MRLSSEFRNSLATMAASYRLALLDGDQDSPSGLAREYLASRGIAPRVAESYQLGVVDDSHDEHARYAGMICLPYLTRLGGVVSLKFRQAHDCTGECGHAKYISPYPTRLYNTLALDRADRIGFVAITEGELNAMTLDYLCGIPAVGIPGAETWKAHPEFRELFKGYPVVLMFPDADDAGEQLAQQVGHDIDTVRTVRLPGGADANRAYLELGAAMIRRIANVG